MFLRIYLIMNGHSKPFASFMLTLAKLLVNATFLANV